MTVSNLVSVSAQAKIHAKHKQIEMILPVLTTHSEHRYLTNGFRYTLVLAAQSLQEIDAEGLQYSELDNLGKFTPTNVPGKAKPSSHHLESGRQNVDSSTATLAAPVNPFSSLQAQAQVSLLVIDFLYCVYL